MLPKDALKDLLHRQQFNNTEKLLICLAVGVDTPKKVREIKALCTGAGFRGQILKANISTLLARSKGRAIRVDDGWELSPEGRAYVAGLAGDLVAAAAPKLATDLRDELTKIKDAQVSAFVEESVKCFEARLFRAAVVLSWVGAMAVMYRYVSERKLVAFNKEAVRRNAKWRPATNPDGLARMKERDFLDLLVEISVIGKNVKQELVNCLGLRNGCGHPNSLRVGQNRTSAHIEVLILNVFRKFST